MKELVIHIGTHKTGSTSIQRSLFASKDELKSQGVFYPVSHTKWEGHHTLAWALGINHPHKNPALTSEEIIKSWLDTPLEKVILSSEDFEFLPKPSLIELKKELMAYKVNVRVIIYVREQVSYLISDYKQHLKMGTTRYTGTIYDFSLAHNFERRFDYFSRAKMWENVFGAGVVHGRIFCKEKLIEKNVVNDFCLRENINCPKIITDNVSMTDAQAYAISILNTKKIDIPEQTKFLESPDWKNLEKTLTHYSLLTDENKISIYNRFQQVNKRFFQEFKIANGDAFIPPKSHGLSKEEQLETELKIKKFVYANCL